MKRECVQIIIGEDDTSEKVRSYFAEIFSSLDAAPRVLVVKIFPPSGGLIIDFEEGNPIFEVVGRKCAKADFRRRYIAEHPVPLKLKRKKTLLFTSTTSNRVRVR